MARVLLPLDLIHGGNKAQKFMADLILQRSSLSIDSPAHEGLRETLARAAPANAIAYALVDTHAAFEALDADWTALFACAGRPTQVFQSFAWNWHWCRHYLSRSGRGNPRLAIVTGRMQGRLVLVMPLVVERTAGLRQLAWMGAPVTQYGDVLAAPEASNLEILAAAWDFAVTTTRADLAALRKVRADAVAAPLLAHLGARITATEEAPYLCFKRAPDHATFEAGLHAKGRKNRRRHMRRLVERGAVTFEQLAGTEEAARVAGYAILMKRAQLKSRDQIAMALADDRFLAFFADVAHGRGHSVGCKVLALRSVNEIAALEIVLEHGGARFLHVAVYGSKFDKCGVGGLLLEHAIEDCFADGISRLDLLAPKHEYKMEFADGTVEVHDHAIALSLGGRAYTHGYLGLRRRLKAGVEGMPAPARRVVARVIALVSRTTA